MLCIFKTSLEGQSTLTDQQKSRLWKIQLEIASRCYILQVNVKWIYKRGKVNS